VLNLVAKEVLNLLFRLNTMHFPIFLEKATIRNFIDSIRFTKNVKKL